MAVKTAKVRGQRANGNVVLPMSAHAAFSKGCEYFGLEERRIPVRDDWRADAGAMADACDDDTVLLVGSAPQYPQGVIDPIAEIAAVALDRDVNCHVDACMGGLVLPFMAIDEPWDFRVPGVTTISADIHKYGYVPKGISVILHRDRESRSRQTFSTDNWLGGAYGSSGILGTKPGGPIAAGWAVFQYLGVEGYERLVRQAVKARRRMEAGIRTVPGLTVLGEPDATLLAIAGDWSGTVDPFAVDVGLIERGWRLDRQGPPDSLHATITPIQEATVDAFLTDLREVAASVAGQAATGDRSTNYAKTE
jgi:glutamate/tyrosine decarboxylase-like PLP-dependent enzyme